VASDFLSRGRRAHIISVNRSIRSVAPTPVADAVAALFASQSGVATEAQLRGAGVNLHQLRMYVDRGEWEWMCGGVVGLRGVPELWQRTPMAAVLSSPRVAITGGTALRFHGIDGFDEYEQVHVVARIGDKPRLPEGVTLQRSRRLTSDDLMERDGVRTTTVATALVHATPYVHADRIGQGLDDLLRRRASPGWVKETADRWTGHGVPGSGVVGALLAERVDQRLPRSWFERLARRALQSEGIEMEHEVPVVDGNRAIADDRRRVPELAVALHSGGSSCGREAQESPSPPRMGNRRGVVERSESTR
jgi:hypothetical protein